MWMMLTVTTAVATTEIATSRSRRERKGQFLSSPVRAPMLGARPDAFALAGTAGELAPACREDGLES